MKNYTIYTLTNPINNSIYYVGCTTNVKARIEYHCKTTQKTTLEAKRELTKQIKSAGLKPVFKEICFTSNRKDAFEIEKNLAKDLIALGQPLLCELYGNEKSEKLRNHMIEVSKINPHYRAQCEKLTAMKRDGPYREINNVRLKVLNEKKKKPVVNDLGEKYESIQAAASQTGHDIRSIQRVLSGKFKQTKGRKYFYV